MAAAATATESGKLVRVFELELARGCANQAVIGGLDSMIINLWEAGQIPIGSALAEQVRALPQEGYRSLAGRDRKAWIERTIAAIKQDGRRRTPLPVPKPPGASPESPSVAPTPAKRPGRAVRRVAPLAPTLRLTLDSPVDKLPGVGKAAVPRFEKLGVFTAGDAVFLFPRRHEDYSDVRPIARLDVSDAIQGVVARIAGIRQVRFGKPRTEAVLEDRTGSLRAVWFNKTYLARQFHDGDEVAVSGKVASFRGRPQMDNPKIELYDPALASAGLVPVYPATEGLTQKTLRHAIKAAVDALAAVVPDPMPPAVRDREGLGPAVEAIRTYHYPPSFTAAEEARQRLALGEFLAIQCAVLIRRAQWQQGRTAPVLDLPAMVSAFRPVLPFSLTRAQEACLEEIGGDLRGPAPMLRLLQGDVGSGKTAVAFAAMLAAVREGYQAALMAPTEILAEQHYRSLTALLGGGGDSALAGFFMPGWLGRPLRVVLLTGSVTPAQKQQIRNDAANGGADILIGTHALLEDGVVLPRLALAVVDEQHRFGVAHRIRLRKKGLNPHLLVMTATPIPRTLALTVYGDLEVSTIDELPPGRIPARTTWVQPHEREEAYNIIRERLDAGEQAFVICPLVEESESLDVRSAEEEFERLRTGPLARYRLDLLHGRMSGRQKDEVMGRFGSGETDVLVSTSVIEVGIDVPNATVIVIEGAERFGLSQLHQFRGRVGRSTKQSYCLLFSSTEDPGTDVRLRLQAMEATTDGFRLAETDLEMRGEGEAWGTIQSGANTMLRVARLSDRDILLRARGLAQEILDDDPGLQRVANRALAAAVKPLLTRATEAN